MLVCNGIIETGFWLDCFLRLVKWILLLCSRPLTVSVVVFCFSLFCIPGFCFCVMGYWHYGVLVRENIGFLSSGIVLFVILLNVSSFITVL